MKEQLHKNILRNINIIIIVWLIASNIGAWFFSDTDRNLYILISSFFCVLLLFLYWFLFKIQAKDNLNEIKKETLYINYPVNIGIFFISILLIILISIISLYMVNKEALNLISVFTLFMNIITMLFPSILLAVFIYFIMPALIIPGLTQQQIKEDNKVFYLLLILFLIVSSCKFIPMFLRTQNLENRNKYKCEKISVEYSQKPLNYKELSEFAEQKLKNSEFNIPFLYTKESFQYNSYREAENFCRSINARVPNHREIYHIVFNKFDTFGHKYYWTSDTDRKVPVLLEFDNMSYRLIHYDGKIKPYLYCVSDIEEKEQKYFIKNKRIENENFIKDMMTYKYNAGAIDSILGIKTKQEITSTQGYTEYPPQYQYQEELQRSQAHNDNEKKHVSFNVKLVNEQYFNELISKGYNYNPLHIINPKYEIADIALDAKLNRNGNIIRLCYYPFTDYSEMNMYNEKEIWKQSFCSPAFELINTNAELKTRYEKDAYCWSKGGRLPNIPELVGILKTHNSSILNTKYWTSNSITESRTNTKIPVLLYFKDSQFVKIHGVNDKDTEQAFTYCIKDAQNPSKVIANYKSRFPNEEGKYYAKEHCPSCEYYEVPDVVLMH